jgi:hypothetical protein
MCNNLHFQSESRGEEMRYGTKVVCLLVLGGLSGLFSLPTTLHSQDRIMGQIQFVPTTKIAKTSGVWVDGQYIGYLAELKGGNRLRLLPGSHEIIVRQAGYSDYDKKVLIEPRTVLEVRVSMERDPRFVYPDRKTSSEVRLNIQPGRAAVFLDDYYGGTGDEYYGVAHGMLVAPGKHRFKIALAGYKTFETEVELAPKQKFELRTDLMAGSINDADPVIRAEPPSATSSVSEGNHLTSR